MTEGSLGLMLQQMVDLFGKRKKLMWQYLINCNVRIGKLCGFGLRPKLKSDEFSDTNVIVHEIMRCEVQLFTAEKVLSFMGASVLDNPAVTIPN